MNRLCCIIIREEDLSWSMKRHPIAKWTDPMNHKTLVEKILYIKNLGTPVSAEAIKDIKTLQTGAQFKYRIGYKFLGEYPDEYWMLLK